MNVVEARHVEKVYPGPPEVTAVREASFAVHQNDHLAVMGASGSGKSTLLNIIGLLDQPSAGSLSLAGYDTGGLPERQRTSLRSSQIGFVFQQFHLIADRDALDNVALALTCQGVPPRQRRSRAGDALEMVGLGHRADALPRQLSGGEQQRVAIARALVGEPALLLADEPTGNLDHTTSAEILDLFDTLPRHGQAVVVVTHDPETARRATRLLRMEDGCLYETDASEVDR